MNRRRLPFRLALTISLLVLALLVAAAAAAGYLVEDHVQHTDRDGRLATVLAYVEHGEAKIQTAQWQQAFAERLETLQLNAQLTMFWPTRKSVIYESPALASARQGSSGPTTGGVDAKTGSPRPGAVGSIPASAQPTAAYNLSLPKGSKGSGESLALQLYAPSLDQNRRLLIALASGLATLLIGAAVLLWTASRWLLTPLRRLSAEVDAVAGGDRIETRVTSPIREVDNVAAAVEGMSERLAHTAEHDARLDAERRLLVSSIAHDLRTPLFSLRGYLDAIATGIGDPRERLDQARSKSAQIDRLVTSLFDYARADIDEHPRLQIANLAETVIEGTAAFELAANELGVVLNVAALTSPSVAIDRDGFQRAFANVLGNALRYARHGGTIEVTCGEDTDGAFVQVVDDGPGIPEDLLPRVFEPMVRADSNRSSRTGGTGLGLAIAARLLRNQGGTIHAANAFGRGAIVTLRLPKASA